MSVDPVIFIDANLYLPLFGMVAGKKLLDSLEEQKPYIFITAQIVDEVDRNKLHYAQRFFNEQFKNLDLTQIGVPDHLFGISDQNTAQLRKRLVDLRDEASSIKADLLNLAYDTLIQISHSQDEVSRRLMDLFDKAVVPSEVELQRARDRREKGNPPGKPQDPLGDQLNWEQLLTHCKAAKKLWIITADKDYCTKCVPTPQLNPLLHRELIAATETREIHCFTELLEGITNFGKHAGVKAQKLPTDKEMEDIREERKGLSIFDWLVAPGPARQALIDIRRQSSIDPAPAGVYLPDYGLSFPSRRSNTDNVGDRTDRPYA